MGSLIHPDPLSSAALPVASNSRNAHVGVGIGSNGHVRRRGLQIDTYLKVFSEVLCGVGCLARLAAYAADSLRAVARLGDSGSSLRRANGELTQTIMPSAMTTGLKKPLTETPIPTRANPIPRTGIARIKRTAVARSPRPSRLRDCRPCAGSAAS